METNDEFHSLFLATLNKRLSQEIGLFIGAVAHAFYGIEQISPQNRTTAFLLAAVQSVYEQHETPPEAGVLELQAQLAKAVEQVKNKQAS